MNNLYYVPLYHFRQNCWARWMVTASDEDQAKALVEMTMGPDWRPGCAKFVCRTKDEIFMEV